MLRLRNNHKICRPKSDGTFDRKFYRVSRVLSETTGLIIVQREPIPLSEYRHVGETAEMWSVSNQLKLGISINPITQRYGSLTLEQRSEALDAFDTFAPQYDAELNSKSSNTSE